MHKTFVTAQGLTLPLKVIPKAYGQKLISEFNFNPLNAVNYSIDAKTILTRLDVLSKIIDAGIDFTIPEELLTKIRKLRKEIEEIEPGFTKGQSDLFILIFSSKANINEFFQLLDAIAEYSSDFYSKQSPPKPKPGEKFLKWVF